MKSERRRAERVRVHLDVSWQAGDEPRKGTISDISTSGCFVLCSAEIEAGRAVEVQFNLAKAGAIALHGEVVNRYEEIGFGMRFEDVGATESKFLQRLIKRASRDEGES